ncbi:unnamed protein product [Clonostachys byssicola]|uniref:Interferon-induced GTP-binding protein Mx n=1 Tax=Clonostachys byssicola TaxID=160290 RepID=A0A9N9U2S7_9HYPO|nr:unnamed protein product [Clonostachys byssicola]
MSPSDLQSKEHRDLLDIIDQLRSQGINRYVDLPEIIVCGDQSAGKSSVLEAISGMSFPTKDRLCTRFATELILRRDTDTSVKISISPGPDRHPEDRDHLSSWQPEADIEVDGLRVVIEEAKARMGLQGTKVFSSDILRIELCGPTQPHLTMVDLPGLFRSGNKEQSEDNVALVKALVTRYMSRPRSIILAVVSAKTEYVLQEVTALARSADPQGVRTIGLITKPDTLDNGSESQRSWVNLALNKDVELNLGWHVLKNRNYEERDYSSLQRDISEDEFFSTGIWTSIDPKHYGVKSLKSRLSSVLKDQILQQLPGLIKDVDHGIDDCNVKLSRLGAGRKSSREQLKYLSQLSHQFTSLMTSAVSGTYADTFFGSKNDLNEQRKRLRSVVQNRLELFAQDMRLTGESQLIVDDNEACYDDRQITRSQYVDDVRMRMMKSRGSELPGLFNPAIVSDLFAEQCQPWKGIVSSLTEDIVDAVYRTTRSIVEHIAANEVIREILILLNSEIDQLKVSMNDKVRELLQAQFALHSITYNPQLSENVQKVQWARKKRQLEKRIQEKFGFKSADEPGEKLIIDAPQMVELFLDETELDMIRFGSSMAVDYMQAYYQLARDRFIDDISVMAVERCLMSKLPGILTPIKAVELEDDELLRLVGESEESIDERLRLTEKLEILRNGLRDINRLYTDRGDEAPEVQAVQSTPASTIIQVQRSASVPSELGKDEEEVHSPPPSSAGSSRGEFVG